jgi:hypothetical protein
MPDRDGTRLVFHGAVVLMAGNLAGFVLGVGLGGMAEETLRAWRVAHTATVGGGVMLIAVGPALRHVALGPRASAWLVWSMVAMGYGAVVSLGVGAGFGVKGFVPTGPPANLVAFAGNLAVAGGGVVGTALLGVGARAALARTPHPATKG